MPNHEPVKAETRTDAEPRPPARLRCVAAATHVGFWFTFVPLYQAELAYLLDDVPGWVQVGLVLVSTFAPVAAAFVAARRSEWRSFLRAHAVAACAAHGLAAAAVLTMYFLDPPPWELPVALEYVLWTSSSVVLLAWVVLPFGAAYRAKDGDMAWYPIISRRTAGAGRGTVSS
jgi:hypothetical protein